MSEVPNTFNFMIAGYLVIIVGPILYIISLVSRWKALLKQNRKLSARLQPDKKEGLLLKKRL